MIKNPHLTILTCDILRYITSSFISIDKNENLLHNMILTSKCPNMADLVYVDLLKCSVMDEEDFSPFKNINSIVNEITIVEKLYNIVTKKYCYHRATIELIYQNIYELLSHPDINYSIESNMKILTRMITCPVRHVVKLSTFALDEILTRNNFNPDVISGRNSIAANIDYTDDIEWIALFLKHGAHVELGMESRDFSKQPYMLALQMPHVLDIIIKHTNHFYDLGKAYTKINVKDRSRILTGILRHGKIFAFKQLEKTVREHIENFDEWLYDIRAIEASPVRRCFRLPIQQHKISEKDKAMNDIAKKIFLFKHNLECFVRGTITVPAYKYYDVAIIILFLMKNPHLVSLTCDVLRYIVTLVFS